MEELEKDKQKNEMKMDWAWFLFSFRGRVNRKHYWIFNLIVFFGAILLGVFTGMSYDINQLTKPQLMFMLWVLWPSMAVSAKRWHDLDRSALWVLIQLIPYLGALWTLVENGFMPGTPGPNRFGPEPQDS